jgi:hypothetical protein
MLNLFTNIKGTTKELPLSYLGWWWSVIKSATLVSKKGVNQS